MQCRFLLCIGLYTPTQYALSWKIPTFKFYVNQKKSKKYLGFPKLKENCSEYSLLEQKCNALFYYVLEYIQELTMLSLVK